MKIRLSPRTCLLFLVFVWNHVVWADTIKFERQIKLPDGKPAAGAKVLVRTLIPKEGAVKEEKRVVADADGIVRTELTGDSKSPRINSISGYIVVDFPGMALTFENFSDITPLGPWTQPMVLDTGYEVKGKILDPKGQPLGGAEILLAGFSSLNETWDIGRVNWPSSRIATPEVTTTSAVDGTYALRPVAIAHQTYGNGPVSVRPALLIRATQAGQTLVGSYEPYALRVGQDMTGRDPNLYQNALRLFPTSTVRGRVVSTLGAMPLAGAQIRLLGYDRALSALLSPATTAADGSFELTGVPPISEMFAEATRPDYAPAWIPVGERQLRLSETPQTFDNLKLQLRPLAPIRGRIVDAATQRPPLTPVTVTVLREDRDEPRNFVSNIPQPTAKANVDGLFTINMPVGSNTLRIGGLGYSGGGYRDPLDVPVVGLPNLTLAVQKEKGSLINFELDDPTLLNQCQLIVKTADGKETNASIAQQTLIRAREWGEKQQIRLVRQHNGVSQEVLPWTEITATPESWPQTIKLKLNVGTNLKGQITDAATSRGLPGATVTLRGVPEDDFAKIASVQTDNQGQYFFPNLPLATQIFVVVQHPKHPGTWIEVKKEAVAGDLQSPAPTPASYGANVTVPPIALGDWIPIKIRLFDNDKKPVIVAVPLKVYVDYHDGPWSKKSDEPNDRPERLLQLTNTVETQINTDGTIDAKVAPGRYSLSTDIWGYTQNEGNKNFVVTPGTTEIPFYVRRYKGFLVVFKSADPNLKVATVEWNFADGRNKGVNKVYLNHWQFNLDNWGIKMNVRALAADGHPLMPWIPLTNDPDNWPTIITLPIETPLTPPAPDAPAAPAP